jgi:hypothetical protein
MLLPPGPAVHRATLPQGALRRWTAHRALPGAHLRRLRCWGQQKSCMWCSCDCLRSTKGLPMAGLLPLRSHGELLRGLAECCRISARPKVDTRMRCEHARARCSLPPSPLLGLGGPPHACMATLGSRHRPGSRRCQERAPRTLGHGRARMPRSFQVRSRPSPAPQPRSSRGLPARGGSPRAGCSVDRMRGLQPEAARAPGASARLGQRSRPGGQPGPGPGSEGPRGALGRGASALLGAMSQAARQASESDTSRADRAPGRTV